MTQPPERAADLAPHQARQVAESFGVDAPRYDRARPSYPVALVRRIVETSPGLDVLDIGCGSGIAARQFQEAGCRVLGVDPDERMAAFARSRGLQVEVATFEQWDPAGRGFDVVACAQAWHWVDPDVGAARAAEALRPGGRWAVFWNAGEPPAELATAFRGVYDRVAPDSIAARGSGMSAAAGYAQLAGRASDGVRETSAFEEPEEWRFEWERPYTRDEWLEQVPTTADHARFPATRLTALLDGLGAVIDEAGGGFVMQYTTVVATAVRVAR